MIQLLSRLTNSFFIVFFFNDTPSPEIYTLSLHDALPICSSSNPVSGVTIATLMLSALLLVFVMGKGHPAGPAAALTIARSEEHTSELQSRLHLVCRLLLEKKKQYPFSCTPAESTFTRVVD